MKPFDIGPEILEHYARAPEADRLATDAGPLELARTQEIVARYLPPPPASVLDVGGGPGVYAAWLGTLGYSVHLVDPVAHHVDQARARAAALGLTNVSCEIGDARSLDRPDASADAVLMLGPLYHLVERADRLTALAEAHRVLKHGGWLFGAAISRFASALDGLRRDRLGDPVFRAIVAEDLKSGLHLNPTSRPDYFTTAYFHDPVELRREIEDARVTVERIAALEGPAWLLADFDACWADPARRESMLAILRDLEVEPCLLGVSAHLLAVARKTGPPRLF